jgi:hypothetical protein
LKVLVREETRHKKRMCRPLNPDIVATTVARPKEV